MQQTGNKLIYKVIQKRNNKIKDGIEIKITKAK
jgi:hypothetical protein